MTTTEVQRSAVEISSQGRRPPAPTQLIPKERYLDKAYLELELQKMWSKVWQVACLDSDIPNVGDFYEYQIGLESILVVRSAEDTISAFHNACQHRGRPLKSGCGTVAELRCPYHGWTYALDGSLQHVPERQEFCPFDDAEAGLPAVRVDQWEQFIFINLDPDAGSLADYLGVIPARLAPYKLSRQYKWWSRSTVVPVNWKLALDAFQEDYHARFIHPESVGFADYVDNPIELLGDHSVLSAFFGVPDGLESRHPDTQETLDSMEWTFAAFGEDTALIAALRAMGIPDGQQLKDVLLPVLKEGMSQAGIDVSELSDVQLVDDWEYHIFPNIEIHVLSFGSWFFRMRPNGVDPESMIFDLWYLHRVPEGMELPPPDPNVEVPEGDSCGGVMDQDFRNITVQQRGLHSSGLKGLRMSSMETRITHMHDVLERYLTS
jgi:phenylpropionate dioxygenase-like ring-hydroxylating dioxygenase large terminal subunit